MKVKKVLLVKALLACKFVDAGKWADAKLIATAMKLPKTLDDDALAKVMPAEAQSFIRKLRDKIAGGETVELEGGGKPTPAPAKGVKPAAEKKGPVKKAGDGGPGVIDSIVEFLKQASKTNPIKKADIVAKLAARFPDRAETSLQSTVNQQVPTKLRKEKNHAVEKTPDGYYIKK